MSVHDDLAEWRWKDGPATSMPQQIAQLRALADDAAQLLDHPSFDPEWFAEVRVWSARWREARR